MMFWEKLETPTLLLILAFMNTATLRPKGRW